MHKLKILLRNVMHFSVMLKNIRKPLFLSFFILILFPLVAFQADDSQNNFKSWVEENVIQLNSLDHRAIPSDKLQFLEAALEGKRVVFLGEPDHWVHEKYDFRLILINYLFKRGWHYVGMEMGRSDASRINKYIATGDIEHLNRVALYGYKGDRRKDRNDSITGIFKPSHPGGKSKFKNEEIWFAKKLREINKNRESEAQQLSFFGYDIDVIPGGGYSDITELLSPHANYEIISAFLKQLARVENESVEEEINRLNNVIDFLKTNRSKFEKILSKILYLNVFNSLLTLHGSLEFRSVAANDPSIPDLIEAYKKREKITMYRQIEEILERIGPNEKIILMGHNMHLSKDHTQLFFGHLKEERLPMWPSIGTHTTKLLPNKVFSMWMLYDHGWHSYIKCPEIPCEVKSKSDSIENLLAQVSGDKYILPFTHTDDRSSYIHSNLNWVINGDGYGSGNIGTQVDAIFFLRSVSAFQER